MLKLIALLGAMTALTSCSDESRFFPRQDFCCEERRFFPRRVFDERRDFCCGERRFFPRRVFEERRDFCCEESRFFPRRFGRPPYYYGDRFAPYAYNWNGGYTNAGYGYNEY